MIYIYIYIDNMFHGPCSPFLFRKKLRELSPNQFSSWGRSYPNLKPRLSGSRGIPFWSIYLRGIFYRRISKIPVTCSNHQPSDVILPGVILGQKSQVCGDDFKEDKRIPLVGWGGYFKKKIQALVIEGLSIAEGYIIFKRVFCMFLTFFLNGFLGEMTWLFRWGRFSCKESYSPEGSS